MKFFSLNKTELSKKLFNALNVSNKDSLTIDVFSDGEVQPVFRESLRGHDVYILADGNSNDDIIKLLLTVSASKKADAKTTNVIYPIYPYARQDKLKNGIRSSISARCLADMLEAMGLSKMITIELHALAIMGFFSVPVIHLNGNKIATNYIKSLNIDANTVCVVSPDSGASDRNKDLAKIFKNSVSALIEKTRVIFNKIDKMILIGEENVRGRNVIMGDDLIDTGGTVSKATHLLKEKGALDIYAFISHFVASGNCLENIYNSALTELIVSDTTFGTYEKVAEYNRLYTTPNAIGILPKITIISCADFLAETIMRVNKGESIFELNTIS